MEWAATYCYWSVDPSGTPDEQQEQMAKGLARLNAYGAKGWELVSVTAAPLTGWEWTRANRSMLEEHDFGRAESAAPYTTWIRYTAFFKRSADHAGTA